MTARTVSAATSVVEHADENGEQNEEALRGDESVVSARRADGIANLRAATGGGAGGSGQDAARACAPPVPH